MARHALISVYDKTGVVDLARAVVAAGYRILSTGGTARTLEDGGIESEQVSDYTGFPEILGGRVKTLHPKIHAGLLARRDDPSHRGALHEHAIAPIELVVVNLYPFEDTIARAGFTEREAIEQIDIGGPSMLRAAAKNHEFVIVVSDPADYAEVVGALAAGEVPAELRRRLAAKVFAVTAAYDAAIARWLAPDDFPESLVIAAQRVRSLRYGENPHQQAAFYRLPRAAGATVAGADFLGGNKELSYNNILDLDAALALVSEFAPSESAACAIIKHSNPCGAACGTDLPEAFDKALAADPLSAFGSIVACNVAVDESAAERMARPGNFLEAVIAPSFSEAATRVLRAARFGGNLRLLAAGSLEPVPETRIRSVSGGLLLQGDDAPRRPLELEPVTRRHPAPAELEALRFAWSVVKHVRSNAIVIAAGQQTFGIGAGQMSRVDAVEIAVRKAGARARGAVLASDAFFPFPDGIARAADAGVTAVIQPGGSRKDAAVIEAADAAGIAMVFTRTRHFKH